MNDLLKVIVDKLQASLSSKRVWTVLAANGISLATLPDWGKVIVLTVTACAYILADTLRESKPPVP